jgi:RimJ/RimL family protein N-acetyltransferase
MSILERRYVVETERLRLRELVPDDIDFVAEMLGDAEVMRYYPKPLDRAGATMWLDRQRDRYARDGHGLWLVEEREHGTPVGQIGLAIQELPAWPVRFNPEVGWLLHRPYWKRGYATEAALGVLDHAFTMRGYNEVVSLIRPVNEPSQAVARRVGMTIKGTTPFHGYDHFVFSISK